MGIYNMMRTGVSGMHAQSNRLSGISDNVANSSTVGYKRTDTQFSTLVMPTTPNSYQSGSVNTHVRYDLTAQGTARATQRAGDAMISGNGFYRVEDSTGTEYMTRAGSFMRDGDGYLVNAAGFYLLDDTGQRIQIDGGVNDLFPPAVTTNVDMGINLDASADVVERKDANGNPIAFDKDNAATYSQKKSVDIYDQQGNAISLDMYYTKISDGDYSATPPTQDTWELNIPGATKGSPITMTFGANGQLTSPTGNQTITLAGANGVPFDVNLNAFEDGKSLVTQTGATYNFGLSADGNAPGYYTGFDFGSKGEVMVSYSNGKTSQVATMGMVTVTSPDSLKVVSGTVYQYTEQAGQIIYGTAGSGVFGDIISGTLEDSNADIATELTDMIESQRNYTANSKVFQTGSDLMEVITNLR